MDKYTVMGRSGPLGRDLDRESADALALASGGDVVRQRVSESIVLDNGTTEQASIDLFDNGTVKGGNVVIRFKHPGVMDEPFFWGFSSLQDFERFAEMVASVHEQVTT